MKSCVRGSRVNMDYGLQCIRESGNRDDPFAVAVKHSNDTVEYVVKWRMAAVIPFPLRT